MNIVSRSDARALKLKKYFTGEPCANGHISERYFPSGACKACINGDRLKIDDHPELSAAKLRVSEAVADYEATKRRLLAQQKADADARQVQYRVRKDALGSMAMMWFRLLPADVDVFATSAWAAACAREPALLLSDVSLNRAPRGREPQGSAMRAYMCHPDDVGMLRDLADRMLAAGAGDLGDAKRAAVAASSLIG